jgi:hypothetical protein
MTEKQADTLLEFLDRISSALEKLVELEARKVPRPRPNPASGEPPHWTRNLPPRKEPPEAEMGEAP